MYAVSVIIIFFQDDLSLKEDHLIDIVTNKPLPRGFYVSGSPTVVPGLPNKLAFGESRVINYLLINGPTSHNFCLVYNIHVRTIRGSVFVG